MAVATPATLAPAPLESSFQANIRAALSRSEYRCPETRGEKDEIARLRHRCYVYEGAIEPNPSGMLWDSLDELPNARVVGVYFDGKLVASMRSHRVALGSVSPGTEIYGDILSPMLEAGEVISDPTRFVVDHEVSLEHPAITYVAARMGWLLGDYFQATFGVATVRREHMAFYRRLLGFEFVAGPRKYPMLASEIWLVGKAYDAVRSHISSKYPFMLCSPAEQLRAFGPQSW